MLTDSTGESLIILTIFVLGIIIGGVVGGKIAYDKALSEGKTGIYKNPGLGMRELLLHQQLFLVEFSLLKLSLLVRLQLISLLLSLRLCLVWRCKA